MSNRPGIMFYFEDWGPLQSLDDSALAALVRAAIGYGERGEVPAFEGIAAVLWGLLKGKIDRDGERYEERKASGSYAVYCRECRRQGITPIPFEAWRDRSIHDDTDSNQPQLQPQPQSQLQLQPQRQPQAAMPPAPEEVQEYFSELGLRSDPRRFWNFYQARGWRIDGQPVADWKALARTWESREKRAPPPAAEPEPQAVDMEKFKALLDQI